MGEWRGKRVVVLGLARQGKALCRYLAQGGAWVTVSDLKAEDALTSQMEELKGFNLEYVLGEHPLSLLEGAETLFLSGGVPADLPLVLEARSRGIRVSNDAQLFLEASPALTVGITGSMGKTTTT
ncbi:MAG TPA: UDP-N-acetylmuramoyl-L-alanine--D-glutamate ligase, partial [Chloroflexi bacterium]|nr:UDP-N-acetylmuramoyl-L-alanine--D-glutamate ligase [Chloroflexota bacterium]